MNLLEGLLFGFPFFLHDPKFDVLDSQVSHVWQRTARLYAATEL